MIFSDQLRCFSEKFRLFVEKFSAGLSELHSTCLLEPCEENIFSGGVFRISLSVSDIGRFFFCFLSIFCTRGCKNCVVRVQKNILRENSLSERILFVYHFRPVIGKFSALWQKLMKRLVETAFSMSIGAL